MVDSSIEPIKGPSESEVGKRDYSGSPDSIRGMPPPPPPMPGEGAQPPPVRSSKPFIAGVFLVIITLNIVGTAAIILMMDVEQTLDTYGSYIGDSSDEKFIIEGIITAENGSLLEDVLIEVEDENIFAVTNEDGEYTLRDVETGTHVIIITKNNYTTIKHKLFVESTTTSGASGKVIELNFLLKEGSGEEETGEYKGTLYDALMLIKQICPPLLAIGAIIVIISAVFAFLRRGLWFVILGSVLGIFFGIQFFIGPILGIISIILVYMSRKEFT